VMIRLTAVVLLFSRADGWSADFQRGADAYVKEDYAAALREWEPLAQKGDVSAQYNLGVMYQKGRGVPQDYNAAVEWYTLAAGQGDALAQYNLGVMYAAGQGVIQNYVRAHMWYNIAASQGNARAKENRELVAKTMTRADISTAQHLADACVMKGYKWC